MPKPPPVYDLRYVLHPEQDPTYVHFENAAANPFRARPDGFPRVNAWWLAEAALASYWPPLEATHIFQAAGLESEYVPGKGKGTDCYVAWQPEAVLVAFRGTQPDQWNDVLSDIEADQVHWDGVKVHRGFASALDEVWPDVSDRLTRLSPTRSVWFCGHSLGAALATLAAYKYSDTRGVCTLGCPRVGDRAFATAFATRLAGKTYRYVNDHDVVTHVPPPLLLTWLYEHVDARRFIAPDGVISAGRPAVPSYFSALFGRQRVLLDVIQGFAGGALTHPPDFLLDHMPKAYATWIWNDYEAHG